MAVHCAVEPAARAAERGAPDVDAAPDVLDRSRVEHQGEQSRQVGRVVWEKRIRDFDPETKISMTEFTRELLRERGGQDGKLHLLGKAKGVYDLLVKTERERRAPDVDDYVFEHRGLTHDPTDFFRRGQIFVSFESDDPAPGYLGAALGETGERLPCFSADYGHWDGVLTDRVKNVAGGPYARGHLAALLAGNCPRFYGRRLADALGARAATATPSASGI